MNLPVIGLAGLLLAVLAPGARAAASYDNCTGFIDSIPAVITTQGTWCLRQDLSSALGSGQMITINTNNVTLDCNDFKIGGLAAGVDTDAYGVYSHSRNNVTVRNCTVRGFYYAVYLFGDGMTVEDSRFDGNTYRAIGALGDGNLVARNRVLDTGGKPGFGVTTAMSVSGDVLDNQVAGVFGDPALENSGATAIRIYAGRGHLVSGNRISNLLSSGTGQATGMHVETADAVRVIDNHLTRDGNFGSGTGVLSEGTSTFCMHNTFVRFNVPLSGCETSTGNYALE